MASSMGRAALNDVSTVAMQCSVLVYMYITCTIIAHKCLGMHVGTFNAALPMELAMVR